MKPSSSGKSHKADSDSEDHANSKNRESRANSFQITDENIRFLNEMKDEEGPSKNTSKHGEVITKVEGQTSAKDKKTDNQPIILAYPARHRPRLPFMNQRSPIKVPKSPVPAKPPPPPPYYVAPAPRFPQEIPAIAYVDERTATASAPEENPPSERKESQSREREIRVVGRPYISIGQIPAFPGTFFSVVVWAAYPPKIPPNVPSCLAHLVSADSLYVLQIDVFDYFYDVEEFFLIQNKNGECLYFVYETIDYGEFALCSGCRGYRLHVMDMYQNEVIFMNRLSGSGSFCCCYPEIQVYAPPINPAGIITQKFNFAHTEYAILDPDRNKMFKIVGPYCASCCCWTLEATFNIHALDSEQTKVGAIKQQPDLITSYFADTDLYGITFPVDMDVRVKAVFLGALFLIGSRN